MKERNEVITLIIALHWQAKEQEDVEKDTIWEFVGWPQES